ncbi:MAG: hypothetical protein QGF59_25840, partial [Pirellulaceae bacterium]|nr:hypothetical protein [Pirellulaceae bacterium]
MANTVSSQPDQPEVSGAEQANKSSSVAEKGRPPSSSSDTATAPATWRVDLLKVIPGLKWLVKRRWFQFAVVLPNVLFFHLFLIAGLFG